jgi:hypothetical protein
MNARSPLLISQRPTTNPNHQPDNSSPPSPPNFYKIHFSINRAYSHLRLSRSIIFRSITNSGGIERRLLVLATSTIAALLWYWHHEVRSLLTTAGFCFGGEEQQVLQAQPLIQHVHTTRAHASKYRKYRVSMFIFVRDVVQKC